jgi:hypothetical protein
VVVLVDVVVVVVAVAVAVAEELSVKKSAMRGAAAITMDAAYSDIPTKCFDPMRR